MALLDSKQLNPKLTGSFILSGSTQTLIGATDVQGSITITDDVNVSQFITHEGDGNTRFNFTDDRIQTEVGGLAFIGAHKKGSAPHQVTINNGGNNIDFVVKDNDGDKLIHTDASADSVLFPAATKISGSIDSDASFGNIFSATHITASGDISASGTIFADKFQSAGSNNEISFDDDLFVTGNISGSSTSTGSFSELEVNTNATIDGDLFVTENIKHKGDVNTLIKFTDNKISFDAGGMTFFAVHDDDSAPFTATINGGGNKINFRALDENQDLLLKTDSEAFRVELYHAGNKKLETTSTGIDVTGNITASANISASGIFTAEGLVISDDANITDDLTVGGNLDIADTIFHTGDSNTKIRFPEVDTISFHTSGDERLRITSTGAISGSAVSTGSFGELEIGNGGDIVLTEDQRIYFEADKATYIESHASDTFRVVVNNRQMFLLDEDTGNRAVFGNGTKVFIGSNNNRIPTGSLHIEGDIFLSGSNGNVTASGHISSSGNLSATGNLDIDGTSNFAGNVTMQNDLTVIGRIDAEEIHTTFVSSSITQATGSNIFGDATTDSHQFTGSVDVSGSFKVSDGDVVINDTLTATNIGAFTAAGAIDFNNQNMTNVDIDSGNIDAVTFGSTTQSTISGSVAEPSGNVSGSATSTGSFGNINVGNINIGGILAHDGDPNTRILFTDDDINVQVGGVNMIDFTVGSPNEITFNEGGADIDFRVEGDNDSNLFFIDASNDKIGVGTKTSLTSLLTVDGDVTTTNITGSGNVSSSFTSTGSFGRVEATRFSGDGSGLTNVGVDAASISGSVAEPSGNISGSATSTGSFGHVSVGEMSINSISAFSSSVATELNTISADIIALSIALG